MSSNTMETEYRLLISSTLFHYSIQMTILNPWKLGNLGYVGLDQLIAIDGYVGFLWLMQQYGLPARDIL